MRDYDVSLDYLFLRAVVRPGYTMPGRDNNTIPYCPARTFSSGPDHIGL